MSTPRPCFEASTARALERARGRDIALFPATEFEGIWRNGGIGTYYRELNHVLRKRGWFTILFNLHAGNNAPAGAAGELGLDHILNIAELGGFLRLDAVREQMLHSSRGSFFDLQGLKSLFLIEALVDMFPAQRVYAEFQEMGGPGYHAAKAKEAGLLPPEVVVAVTMHSGYEWIYEANGALASQDNAHFLAAAVHEEHTFQSADPAMYPAESLHGIVKAFGWRTGHAVRLPYPVPLHDPS
jgi:hypothetical protein